MMKILLADDFALLREDLCETLGAQPDMEVVGAAESGQEQGNEDGHQGAHPLAEFDVLLIDIEMENTTAGIHAAENILAEKPDAIVIFLTAHETENMILMSMGAGAVDYVVKGCPDEELLEHIRKAYEGEPMLDARVQHMVLKEYSRLRRSEKSLLFFINNVSQLTPAERSLVRYLLDGMKVKDIAAARCVEVVTVKTQIKGLLRKFGCTRTKEIVEMIHELGVEHLF